MTEEWLPYREAGVSSLRLWNDDRMTEWQRNDWHFWIKVNPLDFFWGPSRPIRSLDFELSTNRKPRFWQVLTLSSIFITVILSSFRHSTIILSFKSHTISFYVILCHSISFYIILCHSMSFHHSMSFYVILCHFRSSMSFYVIYVILCHSMSFFAILCHSMSKFMG